MARRYINWELKLSDFLESRRDVHFAWGTHDCCMFAADAVRAITGIDPAEEFRGYSTKDEIRELFAEIGGVDALVAHCMHDHGFQECAPGFAKRGDVLIINGPLGTTAGFVGMNGKPTAPKRIGYGQTNRNAAVRAWSVW